MIPRHIGRGHGEYERGCPCVSLGRMGGRRIDRERLTASAQLALADRTTCEIHCAQPRCVWERRAGTLKLAHEKVAIEPCVVGDEDAATEPGRDISNDLRERWRVSNVTAADPVDLRRAEIALRIHEGRPGFSRLSGFAAADNAISTTRSWVRAKSPVVSRSTTANPQRAVEGSVTGRRRSVFSTTDL